MERKRACCRTSYSKTRKHHCGLGRNSLTNDATPDTENKSYKNHDNLRRSIYYNIQSQSSTQCGRHSYRNRSSSHRVHQAISTNDSCSSYDEFSTYYTLASPIPRRFRLERTTSMFCHPSNGRNLSKSTTS